MDLGGIEDVDTNTLAGADTFTVNDLSGTDVTGVGVNLGVDGTSDHVVVNATEAADTVRLADSKQDGVAISGLQALVNVFGTDGPADALTFNALGGNDTVDATGLAAGLFSLTVNGGAGTDILTGGAGTVLNQ